MNKAIGISLFIISLILFYGAYSLEVWNEEYLDPCCNKICGRTTSMEECHPKFISNFMYLIGVILILLGFFSMIDITNLKENKND